MATVRGGFTVNANVQGAANALESDGLASSFGTYPGHSNPEGPLQAIDIFNPDSSEGWAQQDKICEFLIANQARFGVRYVIRREHIWNIERASEGWRKMRPHGNRRLDHYDHTHATFYTDGKGPYEGTTPSTGLCQDEEFNIGTSGPCVQLIQQLLQKRGYYLPDDGDFGPRTEYVVTRFQRSSKLTDDGIVGPLTWKGLQR